MKAENEMRRRENKALIYMLAKEKEKMAEDLSREASQVREMLEKERNARAEEMRRKDKEVCV